MTVTNITEISPLYAGNGTTTAFATGFYFTAAADLAVYLITSAGVEQLQTLTAHYTVSGAGNQSGGTVTMVTAPATDQKLVIVRDLDFNQPTDYIEGTSFPAASHETALDRLTMMVQQLSSTVDRAPVSSLATSGGTPLVFPTGGTTEKGKIIRWDTATGLLLESVSPAVAFVSGNLAASNGMVAQTADSTYAARTITGTASEITVTNGSGVSGNPTISLPTTMLLTGKTVTGGTIRPDSLVMFGQIDMNGYAIGDGTRALLTFVEDAAAVNNVEIENNATTTGPIIRAVGTDTNIDLNIVAKGSGKLLLDDSTVGGTLTVTGATTLAAATSTGTHIINSLTYPAADGTNGQVIKTNGAGVLSFTTISSGAGWDFISTATASASSSIVFTGLSGTYQTYAVIISDAYANWDTSQLVMEASTDNGSTWDTGNNYQTGLHNIETGTGTSSFTSSTADAIVCTLFTVANASAAGIVYINNHTQTTRYKGFTSHFVQTNQGAGVGFSRQGASTWRSTSDLDAIRFILTHTSEAPTITAGRFTLLGFRYS